MPEVITGGCHCGNLKLKLLGPSISEYDTKLLHCLIKNTLAINVPIIERIKANQKVQTRLRIIL